MIMKFLLLSLFLMFCTVSAHADSFYLNLKKFRESSYGKMASNYKWKPEVRDSYAYVGGVNLNSVDCIYAESVNGKKGLRFLLAGEFSREKLSGTLKKPIQDKSDLNLVQYTYLTMPPNFKIKYHIFHMADKARGELELCVSVKNNKEIVGVITEKDHGAELMQSDIVSAKYTIRNKDIILECEAEVPNNFSMRWRFSEVGKTSTISLSFIFSDKDKKEKFLKNGADEMFLDILETTIFMFAKCDNETKEGLKKLKGRAVIRDEGLSLDFTLETSFDELKKLTKNLQVLPRK